MNNLFPGKKPNIGTFPIDIRHMNMSENLMDIYEAILWDHMRLCGN